MADGYIDIIHGKTSSFDHRGLSKIPALNASMFDHQRVSTEFALSAGSAAMFLDTGLGKSLCALDWGRVIVEHTNTPVVMLAPLAVGPQHQREADKFGIDAVYIRDPSEITTPRVYITNYERMEKFDAGQFGGVVLDESSILKSFNGRTSRGLIAAFAGTPYRLACTATPAPNDHMELGQHSEFLGVMRGMEMLSRFFINDTASASQDWRIKGHAVDSFWDWVASWARCVSLPSDLGFSDDGFVLPEMTMFQHIVDADRSLNAGEEKDGQGRIFRMPETSATSIHREKRMTIEARADVIAAITAKEPNEPWLIWCDTDAEADALTDRIPGSVEVRGSMTPEVKEDRLLGFANGTVRILVTKPSIAGYGLNYQHCARQAFVGLSFSYESFYQAIRRSYRFGQKRPVHVHVAMADTEKAIWDVVSRKAEDHNRMKDAMRHSMARATNKQQARLAYVPNQHVEIPAWLKRAS